MKIERKYWAIVSKDKKVILRSKNQKGCFYFMDEDTVNPIWAYKHKKSAENAIATRTFENSDKLVIYLLEKKASEGKISSYGPFPKDELEVVECKITIEI